MKKNLAFIGLCLFTYSFSGCMELEPQKEVGTFSLGTLSVNTIIEKLKAYIKAAQAGLLDKHDATTHELADFLATHVYLLISMYPEFFPILKHEELHIVCNILKKKLVRRGIELYSSNQLQQLHSRSIRALVQLDDGHYISGSEDKAVCVWDMKTAQCVKKLTGHTGTVTALTTCMTDNVIPGCATYIISGSTDKTIRIWEAVTGTCFHKVLEGHAGTIYSIAHLVDRYIVSASADRTLRFWDMLTGKCLNEIACHRGAVYSVIRITNSVIASSSADKTVRLVDIPSGQCLKTFEGHKDDVFCVIALDERYLASASADKTVRIWDMRTGACVKVLEGHTNSVYTLVRINDNFLASGSADKTIRIWNRHTGECVKELSGSPDSVKSLLALSSMALLSGCENGTVNVWGIDEHTYFQELLEKTNAVAAYAPKLKNTFKSFIKHSTIPFQNTTLYTDLIDLIEIPIREKAKSKQEVTRILINRLKELVQMCGEETVTYLFYLLQVAHSAQLEAIADAVRYMLCISWQERPLSSYEQWAAKLKELGCYAIITSDNSVFLVAQNVAALSPYLRYMFESTMKEGQEKRVALQSYAKQEVQAVLSLLNKLYFHKLGIPGFVSNHILRSYLNTMKITIQAIALAEEWVLPQIAQLLTHEVLQQLDEEHVCQLIEALPSSCHKYIAPELAPSVDLLLWQLESCAEAIKLHYLFGRKIAVAYSEFIVENFSIIVAQYANFETIIEHHKYSFIHLSLKEALLKKIYGLGGGVEKQVDIDKLKDVSFKELFDMLKVLLEIVGTKFH